QLVRHGGTGGWPAGRGSSAASERRRSVGPGRRGAPFVFPGDRGRESGPPGTARVHRIAGVLVRIAARAKSGERGTAAAGGGDSASEDRRAPQEGAGESSDALSDARTGAGPRAGSDACHIDDAAGVE